MIHRQEYGFADGIVKERVTESPREPPRNQTGPLWPVPSGVSGYGGLRWNGVLVEGKLMAYCQNEACHSL